MTFFKFIFKLFKIKTAIEYKPETMGFPVDPGTQFQCDGVFIDNQGKTTIYIEKVKK